MAGQPICKSNRHDSIKEAILNAIYKLRSDSPAVEVQKAVDEEPRLYESLEEPWKGHMSLLHTVELLEMLSCRDKLNPKIGSRILYL